MVATGCCGMSGTYGHETIHRATSERVYDLSWRKVIDGQGKGGRLLASGYSCRSQAKRLSGAELVHPIQALLRHLRRT
ncbi:hypothetical protein FQZ97_1270210 [compost metagenome]